MSSIGFPVADEAEFNQLATRAHRLGTRIPCESDAYIRWAPGGGPELWLAEKGQDEPRVVSLNPHFSGPARMRIGVVGVQRDLDANMEGWLDGWADPQSDDDPETGAFPFQVFVPNLLLHLGHLLPLVTVTCQIAAFARSLVASPDEESFHRAQEPLFAGRGMAACSFIPIGSFAGEQPSTALFCGEVRAAESMINPATGARYHHALVTTLGGEIDVVADPAVVEGDLAVGCLVRCAAWLSAVVIPIVPV